MATAERYTFDMPWEHGYGFNQAVRVGDEVRISGQLSHDEEANFVGEGDFETQVRTTLANLDKVLDHFGATRSQIVETTVLVKHLPEHFQAICALHSEYVGAVRPATYVMGVSDLAFPQQLVEIGAVVRLDIEK
ncbi:MAG: RidA family protein [Nocardioides sp.]|uniref:RidA family protein n=1 Tax=Nocardioides sp. TaxID=35761 RepID=UPI0039E63A81